MSEKTVSLMDRVLNIKSYDQLNEIVAENNNFIDSDFSEKDACVRDTSQMIDALLPFIVEGEGSIEHVALLVVRALREKYPTLGECDAFLHGAAVESYLMMRRAQERGTGGLIRKFLQTLQEKASSASKEVKEGECNCPVCTRARELAQQELKEASQENIN